MAHVCGNRNLQHAQLIVKSYYKIYTHVKYSHNLSSKIVRQQFLDYFIKDNGHKFIRSSPVVPFCDPTVAFVNAGMNQFKGIFLGHQDPVYRRVANSQKCVRVGGKHNDINIVGTDGYHHTFFEMLGNWSFGNYFKKEACEMSWNLLTGPYRLHPSALYVTYFGGEEKMQLQPDLECRDIWRSIGVADDHIIPFGSSDNFWEMGQTGPCGPCTEIHIDHTGARQNRGPDVNKGLEDLTELWNLVFIQYNRDGAGGIQKLPTEHIDTGMGLERLTAVLNGKSSNYDTDLFTYLFDEIKKNCPGLPGYGGKFGKNDVNGIDTAYRILADHSRMVTVCLADGVIPEENQKFRRILRKSMVLAESTFKKDNGLLNQLAYVISENLGEIYPELKKNIKQIQEILTYEEEIYKSIRCSSVNEWSKLTEIEPRLKHLNAIETPGLIMAFKEIRSSNITSINAETAFKLYDTYGLDEEVITNLSSALNLSFESKDLKSELENAKLRTRAGYTFQNDFMELIEKFTIPKTDDISKYDYTYSDSYNFKPLEVKVLKLIKRNSTIDELYPNEQCYLILDKTNLYSESGGQISDRGFIRFAPNKTLNISDVFKINGYVFHKGTLLSDTDLKVGDKGLLSLDEQSKVKTMVNHTTTHLLNAALKKVLQTTTCQKSSFVSPEYLRLDVGIYSKNYTMDDMEKVEKLIRDVIKSRVAVCTSEIDSQRFLDLDNVTTLPGEVYPDTGIRLVEIGNENSNLISREPCCGTHVLNTSHIQDICITNCRSQGRSTLSITAVTGELAVRAFKNKKIILKEVKKIQDYRIENNNQLKNLDDKISELKHTIIHGSKDKDILPANVKTKCLEILNEIIKNLKITEREYLRDYVDSEMKTVIELNQNKTKTNKPFIVHFLGCSSILDYVPLNRATKACSDVPVLVLSYSDNMVKARCSVPQNIASDSFNAELWLKKTVANIFKSTYSAPPGQNGALVCNMKLRKVNKKNWDSLLEKALTSAKNFAYDNL